MSSTSACPITFDFECFGVASFSVLTTFFRFNFAGLSSSTPSTTSEAFRFRAEVLGVSITFASSAAFSSSSYLTSFRFLALLGVEAVAEIGVSTSFTAFFARPRGVDGNLSLECFASSDLTITLDMTAPTAP